MTVTKSACVIAAMVVLFGCDGSRGIKTAVARGPLPESLQGGDPTPWWLANFGAARLDNAIEEAKAANVAAGLSPNHALGDPDEYQAYFADPKRHRRLGVFTFVVSYWRETNVVGFRDNEYVIVQCKGPNNVPIPLDHGPCWSKAREVLDVDLSEGFRVHQRI